MKAEDYYTDGSKVVAILEKAWKPLADYTGHSPKVGQTLGVLSAYGELTRLATIQAIHKDFYTVIERARLGAGLALGWYVTGNAREWGGDCGMADYRPSNYDVFGVDLANEEHEEIPFKYCAIPRIEMFVPPPNRRLSCWYMERSIYQGLLERAQRNRRRKRD